MDEPLRAWMRTPWTVRIEISKLQRLGTTIIYITHDQDESYDTGARIMNYEHDVVQQVDTPQTLYDYPCNQFVASSSDHHR